MIYVALFILFFTLVQLLVALSNAVFKTSLPKHTGQPHELVSVLIPARNEEKNIANLLSDLLGQDYQNIEIIVFNDLSTDKTAEIVERFSITDKRVRLVNSEALPEGWLGKNYACYSLSKHASGDYFLFLDADVRVKGNVIPRAISFAQRKHLGLISIFPMQIIQSIGEKMTVPNMNYILLSLLPLILVRQSKNPSLAAANGQFMFFEARRYRSLQPHERVKNDKVEDISIARIYKKQHISMACLVGDNTIQCRMYEGFWEAVNGFSKNVTAFFGNSFALAFLFWMMTSFGFLVVGFVMPLAVFWGYVLAYFTTRILISKVSHQNSWANLLYFIPQQIACGIFIYRAQINKFAKNYQWKDRSIN
jgi:glycosyltransferase involved in cell wall biosynthesis